MRSAQFWVPVLGIIDRSGRRRRAPTLLAMDMDAALTLFSFAGFVALFVSWLLAPMRADAPIALPTAEAVEPAAAAAA